MKKRIKKEGFTIVETLVAVAILVIGITAPITVITSAIDASRVSEDRTLAYYLAQEGIEYVRYVRDTNIINASPPTNANWLRFMNNCLATEGSPCEIVNPRNLVNNNNDLGDCNVGSCYVAFNNGQRVYQRSGPATRFNREIVVDEVLDEIEAEITITVSWSLKGKNYSYVIKETMFNWSGI